ncbi:hypothetical protein Tco_0544171 [Tanacetum coccineum]
MPTHKRIYIAPSHTKKIFGNMRRIGKGFYGRETSLFQTMMVHDQEEVGEDEAVNEEMDDTLERAATTATGLDVEQDRGNINKTQSKATLNEPSSSGTSSGSGPRRQETMGDTIAQTRSENVSKLSNDPLLARETTKTTHATEIASLKKRVKKLERRNKLRTHGLKRLYIVGSSRRVESSNEAAVEVLREVIEETTVAGVWTKLETLYMTKPLSYKVYLKKKLYTFYMLTRRKIFEHIDELNKIVHDLENTEIIYIGRTGLSSVQSVSFPLVSSKRVEGRKDSKTIHGVRLRDHSILLPDFHSVQAVETTRSSGSSNLLARRVIDDLLDFSGETSMLTALIAELEAMGDEDEVFDTLMCLRDDIRDENTKLMGLNDAIAEAEEKIAMKEEHLVVLAYLMHGNCMDLLVVNEYEYYGFNVNDCVVYLHMGVGNWKWSLAMAAFLLLDKLADFSRLQDRMNLVLSGARRDALKSLDYLREMVVRDSGMLGVLEQPLAGSHVGMPMKDGYVTDMQQME